MCKIFQEQEVSLSSLAEHLEDAGWDVNLDKNRILLHNNRGIGFSIRLDTDRQFLLIGTWLPFSADFSDSTALANRCNNEVFMGRFSIDGDGDLVVDYAMTYERGLVLAQLTRIVQRFSGMLNHVVDHFDADQVIFDFDRYSQPAGDTSPALLQ